MGAPVIVQKTFSNSGTGHGTNPSPSLTGVTSGATLCAVTVFVASSGSAGVKFAAPTDSSGQTWPAAVVDLATAGSNISMSFGIQGWVLTNANSGTHNLSFTNPNSSDLYWTLGLMELSVGCTLDQTANVRTTTNSTSLTVTTGTLSSPTELAIGLIGIQNDQGGADLSSYAISDPASGFDTSLVVNNFANTVFPPSEACSKTTTTTSAASAAWTWTSPDGSGGAAGMVLTFAPAGGNVVRLLASLGAGQ